MKNKKVFLALGIVALLLVGLFAFYKVVFDDWSWGGDNDVSLEPTTSSDYTEEENVTFEEKTEEPEQDDKKKTPAPPATITPTEPPLVYTGYGHAPENPLKSNQTTSSTCTSVAGAECYIRFTSQSGETVEFEPKVTDSQGVAIWEWKGKEVGSGTWTAHAIIGELESSGETLYIQ